MTNEHAVTDQTEPLQTGCLLTSQEIDEHRRQGNIIILPSYPFSIKPGGTSYDVRLGMNYYSEQPLPEGDLAVFNPFDEEDTKRYWGKPQKAILVREWRARNRHLERLRDHDFIIVIEPGKTILAHTIEFIGGKNCIATEMRSRSSIGRLGITVCKCASKGDIGFFNRWTMEITNQLKETRIILPVGMRIAQILFFFCTPQKKKDQYAQQDGAYQSSDDLIKVIKGWSPQLMLPKLYEDPDIDSFHVYAEESKHPERLLK